MKDRSNYDPEIRRAIDETERDKKETFPFHIVDSCVHLSFERLVEIRDMPQNGKPINLRQTERLWVDDMWEGTNLNTKPGWVNWAIAHGYTIKIERGDLIINEEYFERHAVSAEFLRSLFCAK